MNRDNLIFFGIGAAIAAVLMFLFRPTPPTTSERLERLVQDSISHVTRMQQQEGRYADLAKRHFTDSIRLSSAFDSLLNARGSRPPSRIHSSDSLLRAIEQAVGRVPRQ